MKPLLVALCLAALAAPVAAAPAGARADTDRNGRVSLAEFRASRLALMMHVDADHDGRLSRAEMAELARRRQGGQAGDGRQALAFRMADTDNDGFLSRAEIDKMVEHRFRKIDVDRDGSLSAGELQALGTGRTGGAGGGV